MQHTRRMLVIMNGDAASAITAKTNSIIVNSSFCLYLRAKFFSRYFVSTDYSADQTVILTPQRIQSFFSLLDENKFETEPNMSDTEDGTGIGFGSSPGFTAI